MKALKLEELPITQKIVQDQFIYKDGILIRKSTGREANKNYKGWHGYRRMKINGRKYSQHRIIFLYHHGYLPDQLDHIDRNKLNNKIENLREATGSDNCSNRGLGCNNKSGYKGVHWDKLGKRWRAMIKINYKQRALGSFDNKEEAALAYDLKAQEIHGAFAYQNRIEGDINV